MTQGWVYIVANRRHGTIYAGVTSNLPRRAWEHRTCAAEGFTSRYALRHLVYAEHHQHITDAIRRERTMKHWPRAWKVALIERDNPEWDDLYDLLARGM